MCVCVCVCVLCVCVCVCVPVHKPAVSGTGVAEGLVAVEPAVQLVADQTTGTAETGCHRTLFVGGVVAPPTDLLAPIPIYNTHSYFSLIMCVCVPVVVVGVPSFAAAAAAGHRDQPDLHLASYTHTHTTHTDSTYIDLSSVFTNSGSFSLLLWATERAPNPLSN